MKTIISDFFGVISKGPYMTWRDNHPEAEPSISTYFKSENVKCDLGQLSAEKFEDGMCKIGNIPVEELRRELETYYIVNQELVEYFKQLKNKYQVFILSNAGKNLVEKTLEKNNLTSLFDEVIVSSNIGLVKPTPEIFNYVLKTYNLNKNEVLFIDDTLENIEAAQALGIRSIHYTNFEDFRKQFESIEN